MNSTATADIGYVEKLPYRRPDSELEGRVVDRVSRIVQAQQADPNEDVQPLRDEVDELIFDLFGIRASRDLVRRFYRTVGRVETDDAGTDEDQAAVE